MKTIECKNALAIIPKEQLKHKEKIGENKLHRQNKGIKIAKTENQIIKIDSNTYVVKSQSTANKFYQVLKNNDTFECECKDFIYRFNILPNHECKHVVGIRKFLTQNNFLEQKVNPIPLDKECKRCGSDAIIRYGTYRLKCGIKKRKFRCNNCNYIFSHHENGFERMMYDPKIVTEALNLINAGLSLRKTANHLRTTYNKKITHNALIYWLKRFTKIMKVYTDTLEPQVSDVWQADEMMLNVKGTKPMGKGRYMVQWNLFDPKTKFWIATHLTKRRNTLDARMLFKKGKNITRTIPKEIITDSMQSYPYAVLTEFPKGEIESLPKTKHTKYPSITYNVNNNSVERLHNEIREKTKTMRGGGNDSTAKMFVDGCRIYHNFLRPHSSLQNKTPAECANIDLNLGTNKLYSLINQSGKKFNEDHKFKLALGKRLHHVDVIDEPNYIRVKAKHWLPKKTWREINDILSLHGFQWKTDNEESSWVKHIAHDLK